MTQQREVGLVSEIVAKFRIGRGEAIREREREGVARASVGDGPVMRFQRFKLCAVISARRAGGEGRRRNGAGAKRQCGEQNGLHPTLIAAPLLPRKVFATSSN